MKSLKVLFLVCALALCLSSWAFAVDQWATSVIGFNSELVGAWTAYKATEALGTPNVPTYGLSTKAWVPDTMNAADFVNWIAVGYDTPVFASAVTVVESHQTGNVGRIELIDMAGVYHEVWRETQRPPYLNGSQILPVPTPADPPLYDPAFDDYDSTPEDGDPAHNIFHSRFTFAVGQTDYLVNGVKVSFIQHQGSGRNYPNIDAIQLTGAVPEPSALLVLGIVASTVLGAVIRRRK